MKIIFFAVMLSVLCACAHQQVNLSALSPGMTKQEITALLGQPESAGMGDGFTSLYFNIHDHAFGRDKNRYIFTFKDDHLTAFAPLPKDQQEMGLVDAAMKRTIFIK